MPHIKSREEDEQRTIPEATVDTKLELLKHLTTVHSGIRKEITEDLVLAKLGDKDKKYVVEATVNAYYGYKLYQVIKQTATRWEWNNTKKEWHKKYLTKQQQQIIQLHSENLFSSFMKRVFMILGVNRNVKDNYLLRLMAGFEETEDQNNTGEDIETLGTRIKEQIKPQET